ncbi:Beta-lactamase superfamily domain [Fragilaria crotonensis]|nr:Beta-lactamase superfamily domain [Fragilaria crotonensis]
MPENATLAVAAMQQEKANRSNNKQPQNNGTTDKTTNASNEVSSGTDGRKQQQMPSNESKHRTEEVTGGIELHGPVGTQAFVHSLRHFMRRDRFEFVVREGEHDQPHAIIHEPKRKKMKKSNSDSDAFVDYTIRALAFQHALDDQVSVPIQSFIFQTPPLVGRFRPDRAAELGIPKDRSIHNLRMGIASHLLRTEGDHCAASSSTGSWPSWACHCGRLLPNEACFATIARKQATPVLSEHSKYGDAVGSHGAHDPS